MYVLRGCLYDIASAQFGQSSATSEAARDVQPIIERNRVRVQRPKIIRTQSAKNTIFAFPKTFTIFYLSIYYFKAKVRLILTLIMVILGNAEIADWVLKNNSYCTLRVQ